MAKKFEVDFSTLPTIDFDRPHGPTNECLSTNQLVGLEKSGPTESQAHHLTECSFCSDLLRRVKELDAKLTDLKPNYTFDEYGVSH